MHTKQIVKMGLTMTMLLPVIGMASEYSGVTIEAKLIGGQQYERLYTKIKDWEDKTGAKVKIISKKSHFELDKEIKSDIAAGTTSWCVGSNHTSFAPQYTSIYADLKPLISKSHKEGYVQALLQAGTIKGNMQMVPRAQFDVRSLYYKKSLYSSKKNQTDFKKEHGYELILPKTWEEVKVHAIFFSKLDNMYGHQFGGKDEALVGTFYEFLISEGGSMFDKNNKPTFNSDAGVKALQWFRDLYAAKAVPAGTIQYVWDELGSGFASGTIALDFDWPGWSGYFNDPKNSKIAGDVGILPPPMGSVKQTGWSGSHGFSITKKCKNKEVAASLIEFITSDESQLFESEKGSLPTRTKTWADLKEKTEKLNDTYASEKLVAFENASKSAFAVPKYPEWGEIVNVVYPLLQKAILGDLTVKVALDKAKDKVDEIMEENGYY
jgi:multiple sugar transport system substrate-binding protein